MDKYKSFYKEVTAFSPYDYQAKVAELLLLGKNVILSVPTGAGKTWAAVVPFLYAKSNSAIHFPKKMIYSSPLRTLTNSIYQDVLPKAKNASIQFPILFFSDFLKYQSNSYPHQLNWIS